MPTNSFGPVRSAIGALALALLTACGQTPDTFSVAPIRQGTGLPDHFEAVIAPAQAAAADSLRARGSCFSPMRDPRDRTEIRMERAHTPRADYAVPAGQYGVAANELLRLDCNTGRPLGVVPR